MMDDIGGLNFSEPGVNTQIEQADKALHPDPKSGIMGLILKARINPQLKPYIDHILSRAIQRGTFDILGDGSGKEYNPAEALVMSDLLTSISVDGKSREELIEMVSEIPMPHRSYGGNGGGGGSYREDLK